MLRKVQAAVRALNWTTAAGGHQNLSGSFSASNTHRRDASSTFNFFRRHTLLSIFPPCQSRPIFRGTMLRFPTPTDTENDTHCFPHLSPFGCALPIVLAVVCDNERKFLRPQHEAPNCDLQRLATLTPSSRRGGTDNVHAHDRVVHA